MRAVIPQLIAYHSPQVFSAGYLITTVPSPGRPARPTVANYLKPGDVVDGDQHLGILRTGHSWRERTARAPPPSSGSDAIANLAGRPALLTSTARYTCRPRHFGTGTSAGVVAHVDESTPSPTTSRPRPAYRAQPIFAVALTTARTPQAVTWLRNSRSSSQVRQLPHRAFAGP